MNEIWIFVTLIPRLSHVSRRRPTEVTLIMVSLGISDTAEAFEEAETDPARGRGCGRQGRCCGGGVVGAGGGAVCM